MRWLNLGIGVAVVSLLALNLRAQLITQQKLDAFAAVPAPPAVEIPPTEAPKVASSAKDDAYVIEAPDILTIDLKGAKFGTVAGPHMVRPDGTVSLGEYGSIEVAGLTVADARKHLESHLSKFVDRPTASLSVHTVNSKMYYVITKTGDGEQAERRPYCGNETVLDVVGAGDAKGRKMNVWVARKTPKSWKPEQVFPVDLDGIRDGNTATNYRLLPGDRVYMMASR